MGVHRYGLRDDQWERIEGMLPGRKGSVGRPAGNNRLFVEAVLYRYRAGVKKRTTDVVAPCLHECMSSTCIGFMATVKAFGVHPVVFSDLLEPRRGVTARIAVRQSATFGETPEDWMMR